MLDGNTLNPATGILSYGPYAMKGSIDTLIATRTSLNQAVFIGTSYLGDGIYVPLDDQGKSVGSIGFLRKSSDVSTRGLPEGITSYDVSLNEGADGFVSSNPSVIFAEAGRQVSIPVTFGSQGVFSLHNARLALIRDPQLTFIRSTEQMTPDGNGPVLYLNLVDPLLPATQIQQTITLGVPENATVGSKYLVKLDLLFSEGDLNATDNSASINVVVPFHTFLPNVRH